MSKDAQFYYLKHSTQQVDLKEWLWELDFSYTERAGQQDKTGAFLLKVMKNSELIAFVRSHDEGLINLARKVSDRILERKGKAKEHVNGDSSQRP